MPGATESDREIRLTWREFDEYVNRYADALAARVGDLIAVAVEHQGGTAG